MALDTPHYAHLESQWLDDLKKFEAHRLWDERMAGGRLSDGRPEPDDYDYYEACRQLRDRLVRKDIKAPRSSFQAVRTYLEERYLIGGAFDPSRDSAQQLVRQKAYWLSTKNAGSPELQLWEQALFYVSRFYGNIVPAVLETDPERILCVLKALQYGRPPECESRPINCFEAALAIYFLDADVIQELWDKAAGASIFWPLTTVAVESWPTDFDFQGICEGRLSYDETSHRLLLHGMISGEQKDALLQQLEKREHFEAVQHLFQQSRLLPRDSTL